MSDNDIVTFTVRISRKEMARRGALGGMITHARHDSDAIAAHAREAFERRFATPQERSAYFAELGRRSAEARRQRAMDRAKK